MKLLMPVDNEFLIVQYNHH